MLGAIGQSVRSVDRAALLKDQLRPIGRAAIVRSHNNRSIAQSLRDLPIVLRVFFPVISRSLRKGFARSTDRAGMGLRDRPKVQEKFCAINRSRR